MRSIFYVFSGLIFITSCTKSPYQDHSFFLNHENDSEFFIEDIPEELRHAEVRNHEKKLTPVMNPSSQKEVREDISTQPSTYFPLYTKEPSQKYYLSNSIPSNPNFSLIFVPEKNSLESSQEERFFPQPIDEWKIIPPFSVDSTENIPLNDQAISHDEDSSTRENDEYFSEENSNSTEPSLTNNSDYPLHTTNADEINASQREVQESPVDEFSLLNEPGSEPTPATIQTIQEHTLPEFQLKEEDSLTKTNAGFNHLEEAPPLFPSYEIIPSQDDAKESTTNESFVTNELVSKPAVEITQPIQKEHLDESKLNEGNALSRNSSVLHDEENPIPLSHSYETESHHEIPRNLLISPSIDQEESTSTSHPSFENNSIDLNHSSSHLLQNNSENNALLDALPVETSALKEEPLEFFQSTPFEHPASHSPTFEHVTPFFITPFQQKIAHNENVEIEEVIYEEANFYPSNERFSPMKDSFVIENEIKFIEPFPTKAIFCEEYPVSTELPSSEMYTFESCNPAPNSSQLVPPENYTFESISCDANISEQICYQTSHASANEHLMAIPPIVEQFLCYFIEKQQKNNLMLISQNMSTQEQKIQTVELNFSLNKNLSLLSARRLIAKLSSDFLVEINENHYEKIGPYFLTFPFTISNLIVYIRVQPSGCSNYKYPPLGNIASISVVDGVISYGTYNNITQSIDTLRREPYFNAIQIVDRESDNNQGFTN